MKKDLLMLGLAAVLILLLVSGTKFQSVEDYYLTHADDITDESDIVTVSIECGTVLKNWEQLDQALREGTHIPKDGFILAPKEYVLRKGDTAFDLLKRITRYEQIQLEYQGEEKNPYGSVYIKGIQYLYEFSCGPLSGWVFQVNGSTGKTGCSRYYPKDGDVLRFVYTCDLGRDIAREDGEGDSCEKSH